MVRHGYNPCKETNLNFKNKEKDSFQLYISGKEEEIKKRSSSLILKLRRRRRNEYMQRNGKGKIKIIYVLELIMEM